MEWLIFWAVIAALALFAARQIELRERAWPGQDAPHRDVPPSDPHPAPPR